VNWGGKGQLEKKNLPRSGKSDRKKRSRFFRAGAFGNGQNGNGKKMSGKSHRVSWAEYKQRDPGVLKISRSVLIEINNSRTQTLGGTQTVSLIN